MRALLVAVAVVSALGPGCARAPDVDHHARGWRDELAAWRHPGPVPSFPLVDDAGRSFALASTRGAPLLVAFVYTRCPVATACPLTMGRLREVRALTAALPILVVTLDPAHDDPGVLAAYAAREGLAGRATFATGEREVVDALASLFNVVAVTRGEGDIAHPVKLALLDAHGAPVREWADNNVTAKEIVDASAAQ